VEEIPLAMALMVQELLKRPLCREREQGTQTKSSEGRK
jgi:hypothetical protein